MEPNYKNEPSYDLIDALELVPLFYTINWTPEKKAEWLRITGTTEATTKVMCDHIRSAIAVHGAREAGIDPGAVAIVRALDASNTELAGEPK